jgi:hypothetical protein
MNSLKLPGLSTLASLCLVATCGAWSFDPSLPIAESPPERRLGPAIALDPSQIESLSLPRDPRSLQAGSAGAPRGLSVDLTSRHASFAFYHQVYRASEGFADRMNWIGDTANCVEGTVSSDFHEDTLRRINYYRAMAGLNADIAFNSIKNAKCQEAAGLMSRNNTLSHEPPSSWSCWSQDAADAAGAANLSLGPMDYTGPSAIDGQMQDAGIYNAPLGHRRWLLYSRAREMGNGGVLQQGDYAGASAIWVIGDFNPAPPTPLTVAWPPAGYVPAPLAFPRWSFGVSGADASSFAAATVAMTVNGTNLPVTVIDRGASGYGDRCIAWEPQGWTKDAPAADMVCQISISGITGTPSSSYHYAVTIFDPGDPGEQSAISGPSTVAVGESARYSWPGLEGGTQYLVRVSRLVGAFGVEGAEAEPAPRIIDGTSGEYSLLSTDVAASGVRSFHLAFPSFSAQSFEIDADYVASDRSELRFKYLRRYSSMDNVLAAEISTTGGDSWVRVWHTNGICADSCSSSSWDSTWREGAVDVSSYAGRPLKIRFVYDYVGSAYIGTDATHGVYVDDVELTQAEETASSETHAVFGSWEYDFAPSEAGRYLLGLAAQSGGYTFPFGGFMSVSAQVPSGTGIWATNLTWNADALTLGFRFENPADDESGLTVERALQLTGSWERVMGVTNLPSANKLTWPRSASVPQEFFRVNRSTGGP